MELGYKKVKAWAVVITTAEARWNYRKVKDMDGPGRLMELDDNYSEEVESIYLSKEDAYADILKRHNNYWHFRTAVSYLNATEFWVSPGEVTVEYGEDGEEIIDMYDWDPDGDLDCTDTQRKDWQEFYESEFEDDEEK